MTAKARDAVTAFLDVDYVAKGRRRAGGEGGHRAERTRKQVEIIGRKLQFDQPTIDEVLAHFIRGGRRPLAA